MDPAEGATPPQPAWAALKDEELLGLRICDLGLRIEGSELEARIDELYGDLAARGLNFRPAFYLGDEWFSPAGVPAIAIPFYLAHPRLKALELHQMKEVEGGTPEWCRRLLRHETGHAFDHAYRFSQSAEWQSVFGSPEASYEPENYQPRPYSRRFVRHLDNWYAQAHPDEDFAETFAVWLGTPEDEWRARYRGWQALAKLEYAHRIMTESAGKKPAVRGGRRISDARKLKTTLERYYAARRKFYAEDAPDFYDADLQRIFKNDDDGAATSEGQTRRRSAAEFMRLNRRALVASLVGWTGSRKYTIETLCNKLGKRVVALGLTVPADETRVALELAAYLAALVSNHLYTGRFKGGA